MQKVFKCLFLRTQQVYIADQKKARVKQITKKFQKSLTFHLGPRTFQFSVYLWNSPWFDNAKYESIVNWDLQNQPVIYAKPKQS